MLCVVEDVRFIAALERTKEKYNIVTHYYAGMKAPKQEVNPDNFVWAIITASKFNIGTISNSLTKLWGNKELAEAIKKDDVNTINRFMMAGKYLLLKNQGEIDGAKSGQSLELSDEARAIVESCVGTKRHPNRMPAFFQFTDNFRAQTNEMDAAEKKVAKQKFGAVNDSVCNRIMVAASEHFKNSNFNFDEFGTFDYRNLLAEKQTVEKDTFDKVISIFEDMSNIRKIQNIIDGKVDQEQRNASVISNNCSLHDRIIANKTLEILNENNIKEEDAYVSLVLYCFKNNLKNAAYKRMFWILYGHIAYNNLRFNLSNKTFKLVSPDYTQRVCKTCGKIISSQKTYCEYCSSLSKGNSEKKRQEKLIKKNNTKKTNISENTKDLLSKFNNIDFAIDEYLRLKHNGENVCSYGDVVVVLFDLFGIKITKSKLKMKYKRKYDEPSAD